MVMGTIRGRSLTVSRQREHLASGGVGQVAVDKRLVPVKSSDRKNLSSTEGAEALRECWCRPDGIPFFGHVLFHGR